MPRPTNTQQRRRQLVLALMRVIARRGYVGASIQEIAREAGMNPGLIHYHFESKQEILLTLFDHLESLVRERLEMRLGELPEDHGPAAELEAMVDAFLALDKKADQLAVACWTAISAEAVHNTELGQLYKRSIRKHQGRIERMLARVLKGQRAEVNVKSASAAIFAAIHGHFLLASAAPGVVPKGAAADSVKRMVRGLLRT